MGRAVNYDLEQTVLGTPVWLHENANAEIATDSMRLIANAPEDLFMRHIHRCLWSAMAWLTENGHLPSEAMIKQAFLHQAPGEWSDDSSRQDLATPGFLAELAERGNCRPYLIVGDSPLFYMRQQLSELSELRRRRRTTQALEAAQNFASRSWHMKNDTDLSDLLDAALSAFNDRPANRHAPETFDLTVKREVANVESLAEGAPDHRINTEFIDLDRLLNGFAPGNLVTIAARTSMGKSALALAIAMNAAKKDQFCAYFSMEMTKPELVKRIMSKELKINLAYLVKGQLTSSERSLIRQRFGNGSDLPIILDDRRLTPSEIAREMLNLDRKFGVNNSLDLIIVDHLGKIPTRDGRKYDRRDLEIGRHTTDLKELAMFRELPVIILSQVNRNSANDERAPRLSDLRDSGAIEEDSDVVIGIYRKFVDSKNPAHRNQADIYVLKNRNGPTGHVQLGFEPEYATFTEPLTA